MKQINRRTFLRSSALAVGGVAWSARSWSQVAGANNTIRVAVVGFKGRGQDHLKGIEGLRTSGENVKVVGLCDVDSAVLESGKKTYLDKKENVQTYVDIRKMLENKDIDAVTIATPNHWHALGAIWAIQAGKDVYVEKPVSHNVWEGRKIVEAARKYNRMVQTGTQARSSRAIKQAVKYVQDGNLGKLLVARGLCYKPRPSIGMAPGDQPIPSTVDYDLWCGPARVSELTRKKLHYDWHWVWNTGNGDLGNQGIHQMDIARWFLGVDELSPRILSVGGRLGYYDDGETPNTMITYHDYARAPLIFEVRGLPTGKGAKDMDKYKGGSVATIIECEGGYVFVGSDYNKASIHDKDGTKIKEFTGSDNHYENFFNAVRSRKKEDLNADILEGHLSSALCHTGNISYRVGKNSREKEILEAMKADKDFIPTYERMKEHLETNEVDLARTPLTLGANLKMDPKTEKFHGNPQANKLLTRDYRKPFVVPEKV